MNTSERILEVVRIGLHDTAPIGNVPMESDRLRFHRKDGATLVWHSANMRRILDRHGFRLDHLPEMQGRAVVLDASVRENGRIARVWAITDL